MVNFSQWAGKAQRWLGDNGRRCFAAWLETKAGMTWQARRRRCSPYTAGFSLPDYHHDMIAALGNGDEETCKAIMLFSR